ncbi:chitin synthesis regulation, resistance to congo red-domain-containing protein [Ampelomyces quisqualis]|uniref:Chitin synthesis regulation, resistance to congo red-domain-containing protein n=1 Tax=Ampelomyces quisqualis TaxID=50730 RepID=A0A6A5QNG2_AMPQU|nr:chitin synthesis regulation, resistance to congo red-domain-containing protein [Ampelomyces quisqualis]
MHLSTRQYYYDDDQCYYQNGYRRCYRSAWDNWVRWVVLAVVVIGFLLLFVLCSCLTARRRRKAGRQPFYGTGWAARPANANNTAAPYYNNNQYSQPAPPYQAETGDANKGYYTGNGANQSYYTGQQQNGVELQQPQPAYGGAQYQPPPGPPPGHGDGIVR